MKKSKGNILVIVAHPDDEVLGCGGTIARYTKEGSKVSCMFLGKGKSSRFEKNINKGIPTKEQNILQKEAENAAMILGITEILFEDFPDQEYDNVPFRDIVQSIENVKKKIEPDIIFTHHPGDINIDHQIVYEAVITACQENSVQKIYSFVIPAADAWKADFSFSPNMFVDIKTTFGKKQQAMMAYQSELKVYPHPRSLKVLEIVSQYWGTILGKEYIEPFEVIRKVP